MRKLAAVLLLIAGCSAVGSVEPPRQADVQKWNEVVWFNAAWQQHQIDVWNWTVAYNDSLNQNVPSSHPFLVCTRQRESGGNYAINTGNGYYGAYQFLISTWNSTANAAGRYDLVGVLPSNASIKDQDDMALFLYERAGNGPWGGRC